MIKHLKFILSVSFISMLVGCGSGSSLTEGGIDGTGITAGRITGFGSIIVNGIRFDVNNATFSKDGVSSQQSDFLIGEYVVIKGSIDEAGLNGTATEVIFEDLLEGQVTNVSIDGLSIEVLGQTITTNQSTVFHGFNTLTELNEGSIVEISGFKDADGISFATSIELEELNFVTGSSENEIKGIVSNVNAAQMTFQIAGLIIDYSTAELDDFVNGLPVNGQFVEVKSDQPISANTLFTNKVELEEGVLTSSIFLEVNLEGLITRFVSVTDFDINGIAVTTNNTTKYEDGLATDLALNVFIKIKGKISLLGILFADEIEFEGPDDSDDS